MPENITKIPTHLNKEIYSPKINKESNGTITNDNAKNGYAKLRLNFERIINQIMKPPAYRGIANKIQGLLKIDRTSGRVLFFNSRSVILPIWRIPNFRNICPIVPTTGAAKTNKNGFISISPSQPILSY